MIFSVKFLITIMISITSEINCKLVIMCNILWNRCSNKGREDNVVRIVVSLWKHFDSAGSIHSFGPLSYST